VLLRSRLFLLPGKKNTCPDSTVPPPHGTPQTVQFTKLGTCAPEGYPPTKESLCYSSDELYKVNPRPPLTGGSTAQIGIDQLLCVVKTNNAYQVRFQHLQ